MLKWILGKLGLDWVKVIAVLIVLAAIGGEQWWIYNKGSDHGKTEQMASDQKVIDKTNKDRDAAVAEKTRYVTAYKQWVADTDAEVAKLKGEQKAIVDDLKQKLASAQVQANKPPKVVYKEVTKYVTADDDARCILPRSVIRLYDVSIKTGQTDPGSPLSGGYFGNDSAPSGIPLSAYTGIVVANNARAVYYLKLVLAWQEWYQRNRSAYEQVRQYVIEHQPQQSVTPK